MPNVTVRNLREEVHRELKRAADAYGRSINAHVVRVLELSVYETVRRRRRRGQRQALESFVASLPATPDSSLLIREDRDSR